MSKRPCIAILYTQRKGGSRNTHSPWASRQIGFCMRMSKKRCARACQLTTFLVVRTRTYVCTYVHHENRSLIQSLALMGSAISLNANSFYLLRTHCTHNLNCTRGGGRLHVQFTCTCSLIDLHVHSLARGYSMQIFHPLLCNIHYIDVYYTCRECCSNLNIMVLPYLVILQ